MTQEQLAKHLKISRPSLANIEAGRQRIMLHQIFAFEKVLGIYSSLINQARGRKTG